MCFLGWLEKGIWSVLHLIDEDGKLLTLIDWNQRFTHCPLLLGNIMFGMLVDEKRNEVLINVMCMMSNV